MKTLILGDVHGRWELLNRLLEYLMDRGTKFEQVIQIGDFGYWPRHKELWHNWTGRPFGFIDGNHEDFDSLWLEDAKDLLDTHRLTYIERGTIIGNVGFMGGATSRDKSERIQGDSWFKQENIGLGEPYRMAARDTLFVDTLLTHEIPANLYLGYVPDYDCKGLGIGNNYDPNAKIIQDLHDIFKPRLHICGHHHRRQTILYKYGKVEILDMLRWEHDASQMVTNCCYFLDMPSIK